jgi:glucose/mannose transport system permease protein
MAVRWTRITPQLALSPAVLVTLVGFVGAIGWTIFMSLCCTTRRR